MQIWWTALFISLVIYFTQHRYRCAYGSWLKTKVVAKVGRVVSVEHSLLMLGIWAKWLIKPTESYYNLRFSEYQMHTRLGKVAIRSTKMSKDSAKRRAVKIYPAISLP